MCLSRFVNGALVTLLNVRPFPRITLPFCGISLEHNQAVPRTTLRSDGVRCRLVFLRPLRYSPFVRKQSNECKGSPIRPSDLGRGGDPFSRFLLVEDSISIEVAVWDIPTESAEALGRARKRLFGPDIINHVKTELEGGRDTASLVSGSEVDSEMEITSSPTLKVDGARVLFRPGSL